MSVLSLQGKTSSTSNQVVQLILLLQAKGCKLVIHLLDDSDDPNSQTEHNFRSGKVAITKQYPLCLIFQTIVRVALKRKSCLSSLCYIHGKVERGVGHQIQHQILFSAPLDSSWDLTV